MKPPRPEERSVTTQQDWGGPAPKIVTLCGSTRFREEIEETMAQLTLEGRLVISLGLFGHDGDLEPEECERGHPVKDMLDELHFRKIDLADEVVVVSPGGYVGESTSREVRYAEERGIPVSYTDPPEGRP